MKVDEEYGNIVLLEGTDKKSRFAIDWLTDCRYHHSGILTSELTMDIMTQKGVVSNHLIHDMVKEEYDEYLILEHVDMTPELREMIKWINENMFRDKEYDNTNIKRLGRRLLVKKLTGREFDTSQDISSGRVFCHSRVDRIYKKLPIDEIASEVDSSQIIPPHFLGSRVLRVVGRGNRTGRFY